MLSKTGSTRFAWNALVDAIILGRGHSDNHCVFSFCIYSNDNTTLLTQEESKKKPARSIHDVNNPYALFVIVAIFMSPILCLSLQLICMFEVRALATSQQSTAAHSLQSSKLSSNTSKYFAAFFRHLRTGQRVTQRIQGCCQTFAITNAFAVFMQPKRTRATLLLLIFCLLYTSPSPRDS